MKRRRRWWGGGGAGGGVYLMGTFIISPAAPSCLISCGTTPRCLLSPHSDDGRTLITDSRVVINQIKLLLGPVLEEVAQDDFGTAFALGVGLRREPLVRDLDASLGDVEADRVQAPAREEVDIVALSVS